MPMSTSDSSPPKLSLSICEVDIMKMILEFLESRELHISQIAIERETGIINGVFSSDCLFLRQLIVDGSWDAALDFVEPLKSLPDFNYRQFKYLILKYKYFELLCIKNEPGCLNNNEFTVEELVECLHSLENVCPSLEDYRWLCALLTLPKLADDIKFASWNPSLARIECFNLVFPLVQKFLSEYNVSQSPTCQSSTKDRLLQLVVRGLLYENCMLLCQSRAIKKSYDSFQTNILVEPPQPLDPNVDGSLFSWLKAVPSESFILPFSRQILDIRVDKMKKPSLEAAWTEQILATPLKPDVFPYNATPISRLKSAHKMSLSMIPQYESANRDKNDHIDPRFIGSRRNLAALTTPDRNSRFLSQSIAVGFQLGAGNFNLMQQSAIDVLLETSPDTRISSKAPPPQPIASSDLAKSNVAVVAPSTRHSRGSISPDDDDIDLGYEEGSELRRQHVSRDSTPTPVRSEISTPVKRPMSARQHLDDLTRKTSVENRCSLGTDAGKSQQESAALPANLPSGKLYEEFNKSRRTLRTTNDEIQLTNPGNVNNNVAYQLMQMSLYSSKNSSSGYGCQDDVIPEDEVAQISSGARRRMQDSDGMTRRERKDSKSSSSGSARSSIHRQVSDEAGNRSRVKFVPICRLEDQQAIRTSAFHPSGKYFAVGTNSRQLHVCKYPDVDIVKSDYRSKAPEILLTRPKQHRGSVYTVAFNPSGELLATGSNDKTIRLMQFSAENCRIGSEFDLTFHDGTVRDIIFMEDTTNNTSLLISGGAGNCKINVIDCATGGRLRALDGHTAPILGLYTWGGCMFVSCSQDKTTKFWDLRCGQAVATIYPDAKTSSSPVTSVCVDVTGRLLVSGHEDSTILLYDVQGSRMLQRYQAHGDQVRTVRFSPGNYYLLSGSYDKKIVITDMRGDLMGNLQYLPVAEHDDKIIQCRWHPHDFTFLSTSADKTVVLWSLPAVVQ